MSPWDDEARAEAEALWEAEQLICPQCGGLREECSDPDKPRFPQRHICYNERARLGALNKFRMKNEKSGPYQTWNGSSSSSTSSDKTPFHYSDGVRVYVAPFDVNPDDGFI